MKTVYITERTMPCATYIAERIMTCATSDIEDKVARVIALLSRDVRFIMFRHRQQLHGLFWASLYGAM